MKRTLGILTASLLAIAASRSPRMDLSGVVPAFQNVNAGQAASWSGSVLTQGTDGEPLALSWNFGDGSPADILCSNTAGGAVPLCTAWCSDSGLFSCPAAVSHVYTNSKGTGAGPSFTWTATLAFSTSTGGTTSISPQVTVTDVAPSNAASAPALTVAEGYPFLPTFTSTSPSCNDAITLQVNWGDGTSTDEPAGTGCTPISISLPHLFPSPGFFTVIDTFSDDEGLTSSSVTQVVTVVDSPAVISSVATNAPVGATSPATVWINLQSGVPGEYTFDYAWDGDTAFTGHDDVLASTSNVASFTSATAQTVDVLVRVHDGAGNTALGSVVVTWVPTNPADPTIQSPTAGQTVITLTPTLLAAVPASSADPDHSALTFEFQVDASPFFDDTSLADSGPIAPIGDFAQWTVVIGTLQEYQTYYWRVRALAGTAVSDWVMSSFFVDAVPATPSAPVPLDPIDGQVVEADQATLAVLDATDADGSPCTYSFAVSLDSAGHDVVETVSGIAEQPVQTGWTPTQTLSTGTRYFWTAQATNGYGIAGPASTPAVFTTFPADVGGTGCDVVQRRLTGLWPGLLGLLGFAALVRRRNRR